jgi:hypothetical protein
MIPSLNITETNSPPVFNNPRKTNRTEATENKIRTSNELVDGLFPNSTDDLIQIYLLFTLSIFFFLL